ncbi:MAG: CCA tRNA nucleotidyltransferase, partial [Holophagaceae bacterium]
MNTLDFFLKQLPTSLRDQLYGVGGAIRDHILGKRGQIRPLGDVDLACSLPPHAMLVTFEQLGMKVIPTGLKHGTITVLCGDSKYEITSFRSEKGYSDFRHPDEVVFNVSLEEDLSRRDFTMNALAIPLAHMSNVSWDNFLIDPFGGKEDIHQKVIRCVGEPNERFTEDPLRMLRACRFASQLDFEIHSLTLEAVANKVGLIRHVSRERIVDELNKLLVTNNARGIEAAIQTGLLDEIFESKSSCRSYFKKQPFKMKASCTIGERWYLLIDWALKAHQFGYQESNLHHILSKFPLANREYDLICSLLHSQQIMASINYDTHPQSEEKMHAIRLNLSQIKQQGLDPMAFMRVHGLTNPSLNDLESIWIQVLSTNPPLLIKDLVLKPSEIIEFYKLTPGSWIRSVQEYLLD